MKKCLVGFTPDHGGHEAIALACLLASRGGLDLVVCVVVPESWEFPAIGRVDAEYEKFLNEHAKNALAKAKDLIDKASLTVNVQYEQIAAASATDGLTAAAEKHGAHFIIVGSARHGPVGRLIMGGVTEEIMHISGLPVAMAPRDYVYPKGTQLPRVTLAYSGGSSANSTVREAKALAAWLRVPLRLVSFAVRDRSMFPTAGMGPDNDLLNTWREQAQASLRQVKAQLNDDQPDATLAIETEIGYGVTWDDALADIEWQVGELLLLGSSHIGLLQRVFLGSNASKILRASPVPVMVLPRG